MLDWWMDITADKKFTNATRFKATYALLAKTAKLKYFKPCVKHYLNSQVQGNFALVTAPAWEIATFLPTAAFRTANNFKV